MALLDPPNLQNSHPRLVFDMGRNTPRKSLREINRHQGERQICSWTFGRELFRAFRLLFTELIGIALALTTIYLFGLIFIYLQRYPLVYSDEYGFNSLQEGAMFLVSIGGGLAALATQPVQNWLYRRSARGTRDEKPRPEARLYTACFAVWMLPVSIFVSLPRPRLSSRS